MLQPVGHSILFVFLDDVVGGKFQRKSESGIMLLPDTKENGGMCRWGKVLAVGSRVDETIKPKMNILIEPLKWTIGFDHDGVKVWRTKDECIAAIEE